MLLPDDFTRAELAQWANAAAMFGSLAAVLVVLLLSVLVFRGK